ncbi:Orotidine 5'-phosphate decarboxylase [Trichodelitschia bisporula]|uniref:Orotidine 5'-phosphate decarboxylase n=1 Tax=Trichodelitschia bisporula TaxID=703511 RepID=A0A6G1HKP8_9PEZI|nr:Orotidine 5'-phosphate decarboxylase [Trichodelitschia bisporula]
MAHHAVWTMSFKDRAALPNTPPLAAYLLYLMTIKQSNLCLSADVTSTAELLALATEVGDSICLLKTHADIIDDFGDRTVRALREIARQKNFLVFEDRKFGDIGSTVQKQYTAGPLAIAKWAEITNAHLFPGPAIVPALKSAAASAIAAYNTTVHTEISVGPPASPSPPSPSPPSSSPPAGPVGRKQSTVSISTTISTRTEPISPQPTPGLAGEPADVLARLGATPYLRALLLLAEMSSEGHMLTPEYREACVKTAREHRDFVIGFVAQRALNAEPADNFITFTPGVSLPPPGQEGVRGDGLGQQYETPRDAVLGRGCDVVIVGRGILRAEDRAKEAERYRREAWRAYEERVGAAA